jgi:hypothetical protein
MYYVLEGLFLAGIGIVALATLWFLLRLFRARRGLVWPLMLAGFGVALVATPIIYTRVVTTIDLGERERVVDGELHITLTGWDRTSYEFLANKPDIVVLQMANPDVTDETLKRLAGQRRLKTLDLNGTQVTDQGLAVLAELSSLQTLRLRGTKITDAGLKTLFDALPELKQLDLQQTAVSQEPVDAWKAAKPGRRVLR